MKLRSFATLFWAATLCSSAWSQDATKKENPIWEPCPQLAYLPESDSVARRATVDSVAAAAVGRWKLVEIAEGWGPNRKPIRRTEMAIDRDGKGTIYEEGRVSSTFQLTLKRRYNSIWFTIAEPEKPFFNFRLRPGRYGLFVFCSQKLILSDARGDGTAFAFRRVPPSSGKEQRLVGRTPPTT